MSAIHKLCEVGDLPPGQGKTFSVAGRSIALFNVGGNYHAIDDECSHEGGPLGEGVLEGNRVACPWHGAEFDVTTGEPCSPPADCPVSTFRVSVDADVVSVEIP
jgi:nitrite reductase/ring-hydroxylating ferredoxin subunit